MEPAYLSLLLLAVALVLFIAEFFIPSGGMIVVLALVSLAASGWFAWQAWGESDSTRWWVYVASVVILIPAAIGGMLYIIPRTSFGRQVFLQGPSLEEVTPYAAEQAELAQLIGKVGKTVNLLTPGGLVLLNGERMHCESEGVLIDPGQDVVVIGVKGNRLVVRLAEHGQTDLSKADLQTADGGDEVRPLDFDLPQT